MFSLQYEVERVVCADGGSNDNHESLSVSVGGIRLLRQRLFKCEHLVPPLSSKYVAIALPWGCSVPQNEDVHESTSLSSSSTTNTSLITPSELLQRTIDQLLLPFDLYFRERLETDINLSAELIHETSPSCSLKTNASDMILQQFGLWCSAYEVVVDPVKLVSYLRIDFVNVGVMRLMSNFVLRIQFSSLGTSTGATTFDHYHQRRFVLFPLYDPSAQVRCDMGNEISVESFYEIPACAVCLDRLDLKISGLSADVAGRGNSICAIAAYIPPIADGSSATRRKGKLDDDEHSEKLHSPLKLSANVNYCTCVSQSSCPICRLFVQFVQRTPEGSVGGNRHMTRIVCDDCGIDDDLYQCLLCGHVGCSRYRAQHARKHYSRTASRSHQGIITPTSNGLPNGFPIATTPEDALALETSPHSFSMCLASQEIWDYEGDAFAHRLVARIPLGAPGAIKQLLSDQSEAQQLLAAFTRRPNDKKEKGEKIFENVIDEYLEDTLSSPSKKAASSDDPHNKKACPCPPNLAESSLAKGQSNDNDLEPSADESITDVAALKYDAKVEQLCVEYSALLSQQMAEHRQSFEDRMRPLLDIQKEMISSRVNVGSGESSPKNAEVDSGLSTNVIDLWVTRHQLASAHYAAAVATLSSTLAANNEVQQEERDIQRLIADEKQEIHDSMAKRLEEIKSRDSEIADLREMIAEVEMNLAAKTAIERQGGASAMFVMGSGGGRGRGRGGNRR